MNLTIPTTKEELIRFIDEKNDYLWKNRGATMTTIIDLTFELVEKAKEIDYAYGIARGLLNTSLHAFIIQNNPEKAFEILADVLERFKTLENKKWVANTYGTFAIIQNTVGKRELALYNILHALDFYQKHPQETDDRVMVNYIAGTIYSDLKKNREAEKYYREGIKWESNDNSNWNGRLYSGLARIYVDEGRYDEALKYSFIALDRLRSENNSIGESRALSDIGVIYKKLEDYSTALDYLHQGLKIREERGAKQFIIVSHLDIAGVHNEAGDAQDAIVHLEKALHIALEMQYTARLPLIYQQLSASYKNTKDFEKVAFYLEKQIEVSTAISKKETEARISELHNTVLKEKEDEIERLKNVELKNAYDLISEKNKEITDSINYAKRIQLGILPSPEDLTRCFAQHFVLYKPKDIVSGDFYWCKKVHPDKVHLDISVMAAVDCTGHGVPGAFMSMLGHTLLNQAIKSGEVTSPADALNYLNKELPNNLRSQDKQQSIKDGMDLVVCAIEWNSKKLMCACANNPTWIVRDKKVIEIRPDKQAVSASDEVEKKPFTNKEYQLQAGDMVYLFTDGYADQFGGPKGKKFKYSTLQNLLAGISDLSMEEQRTRLETTFEEWRGNLEQVDDVLIIGIKIP